MVTSSHLLLLLVAIKLKFDCVLCGYKVSFNISLKWNGVGILLALLEIMKSHLILL